MGVADKAVALHALHQLLRVLEAEGSVPQWWWGEMVATLTLSLRSPPLQVQALAVIRTFVQLLQEEQLARGLQQLVLMLLPYGPPGTSNSGRAWQGSASPSVRSCSG